MQRIRNTLTVGWVIGLSLIAMDELQQNWSMVKYVVFVSDTVSKGESIPVNNYTIRYTHHMIYTL